ncbi:membrane protein [Streptococcus acidominimus]|uniref:Membrane protein n=1 Tax=Streptococcus acidominimus TaxID=1326 RepID=A0A239X1Q6_STRAI|nr:alkaline shock response membrane anchor protein AmaP [Streptococcus acidominimus]SNV40340.1 membrane protein [Streptococcus acidominimus]
MAKGLKIIYSLIGLVLLTILAYVIVLNQRVLRLPALAWLPVSWRPNFWFREALAQYFLWVSVILFIVVLVGILVIIFFPRRYSEVELADNQGKLKLKKSAVEGYVKSLVESEGLMKNPRVTANLYKKKFKVDVKGQVVPRTNVIANTEQLKKDLETGLKAFFGVEHDVDFAVKVKDVVEERQTLKGRVE